MQTLRLPFMSRTLVFCGKYIYIYIYIIFKNQVVQVDLKYLPLFFQAYELKLHFPFLLNLVVFHHKICPIDPFS